MNKELLEKLQNAKTDEERKQIIEANKVELTDAEIEKVGGGISMGWCGATSGGKLCK